MKKHVASRWTRFLVRSGPVLCLTLAFTTVVAEEQTVVLSKVKGSQGSHPFVVEMTVLEGYNLTERPLNFRLKFTNKSDQSRYIRNPVPSLRMTFLTSQGRQIDLPVKAPPQLIKTVGPNNTPAAAIKFTRAIVRGQEWKMNDESFQVAANSDVSIEFECLPVVGAKIMEAVGSAPSHVTARFFIPVIDTADSRNSGLVESPGILLATPKESDGQPLPPDAPPVSFGDDGIRLYGRYSFESSGGGELFSLNENGTEVIPPGAALTAIRQHYTLGTYTGKISIVKNGSTRKVTRILFSINAEGLKYYLPSKEDVRFIGEELPAGTVKFG